ncbi:MAG: hypothetical protein A2X48_03275 [Lentisphaerae bacterium GWF2_49_21]|nr:MAG: hypothetical protein A2X48_03275 [Lentisphaerae bacterium GWF2_49_21]
MGLIPISLAMDRMLILSFLSFMPTAALAMLQLFFVSLLYAKKSAMQVVFVTIFKKYLAVLRAKLRQRRASSAGVR